MAFMKFIGILLSMAIADECSGADFGGGAGANIPQVALATDEKPSSQPDTPNTLPSVTGHGALRQRGGHPRMPASQGGVNGKSLQDVPLLRPGEALELRCRAWWSPSTPGDGKANQIFCAVITWTMTPFYQCDGVPANMPTIVDGQGYSDVNFLMPELVTASITAKARISRTTAISRRRFRQTSSTGAALSTTSRT